MRNKIQYTQQINQYLQKIRHKILGEKITLTILFFIRYFTLFLFASLLLEKTFYFQEPFRATLYYSFGLWLIVFVSVFVFRVITINFGLTRRFNVKNCVSYLSRVNEKVGNRFLDSYQLLNTYTNSGTSQELILYSVKETLENLNYDILSEIIDRRKIIKKLKATGAILFIVSTLVFINFNAYTSAFNRLSHYDEKFPVPTPFSIKSQTGNAEIFSGDTVHIKVNTDGQFPQRVQLSLIYDDYTTQKIIPLDSAGAGEFSVNAVTKNFQYEAFVLNHSIFQPWNKISSGLYNVTVKGRPEVVTVKTTIMSPEYTGIEDQTRTSNNPEFFVMPGAEISISAELNKPVEKALLDFSHRKDVEMTVIGERITGKFQVTEADQYQFSLIDANDVKNINPIEYKIQITPDDYPSISLLSPQKDFQLSEEMRVPLLFRISDDFGFTKAFIHYKLLKKYGERNNEERDNPIPIENQQLTFQEISYNWNVETLGLSPEDGVEFYVEIYDNDPINGPKKATSRKITTFFPSLNDMFSNVNQEQKSVENSSEEVLNKLLSSKEVLKEISRKLLKDPKLTWEQKKQLQKEMNKTEEAGKKMKKLAEKVKEMKEQGEKNNLFSKETLKKYSELQKSMQDIMTPELRKAMEELQKAIDKENNKKTQKALEKFKTNHDDFTRELDRMLKLMKRVKIEQSVDELVKRIEDLTNRQDTLSKTLNNKPPQANKEWNAAQKAEKNIENDTRVFEDILKQTAKDMEEFPIMNQEKLKLLHQKMQDSELYNDMKQSQQAMQMRNLQQSQQSTQQAGKKLSDLQQQMKNFQQEFQQKNMEEITSDFQNIILKSLSLSQSQETLNQKINNSSRLSEQMVQLAKQQNKNRQNLSQLIDELTALSQKTFGVSSESAKNIGQSASEMQKTIQSLANRQKYGAKRHGKRAQAALNKMAIGMMKSMEDLQQSGQSSGFQSYMQKMKQMAQQQKGLNQQTQQKGPGMPKPQPGGRRPGSLQQLAARQRQIQNSLKELQKEIESESGKQPGTLKGIGKDMDDVIKDLENNKVLRKTIERQQRILTRMLEAQKSLRTQSYKKERESQTADFLEKIAPGELPENLGERNILLRQKLEEALNQGYSEEYKKIIRKYFEELSKEEANREK